MSAEHGKIGENLRVYGSISGTLHRGGSTTVIDPDAAIRVRSSRMEPAVSIAVDRSPLVLPVITVPHKPQNRAIL